MVLAISAKALAALAAAVIFSGTIPETESEKPFNPSPNLGRSEPNLAMLLSPVNQATIPPSLGMVDANSERAFAATAEALTALGSMPDTVSAYRFIYGANVAKSLPNLTIEEPPVNHEVKLSNTLAAVIDIIIPTNVLTPVIAE